MFTKLIYYPDFLPKVPIFSGIIFTETFLSSSRRFKFFQTIYIQKRPNLCKVLSPIECLEKDMLNKRNPVYLYIIDLCTELDKFCLLTPYDKAYIMTVNTDIDLSTFKHSLFLYKNLSDYGKSFLIILCIFNEDPHAL